MKKNSYTLMQNYRGTPNIFTLVQTVKISFVFFRYIYINQGIAEALKVISFQYNLYVMHGRGPSKGTMVLNIHTFSTILNIP